MIDWRLYRLAFFALVPAVLAILFSVDPVAKPLPPGTATTGFDGRGAASVARQVESLGEERSLGSEGDKAAARLIAERFGAIPAGALSRAPVSEGGLDPGLASESVFVSLPGETDETILVVAKRTADSAAGRLATATATGVLVELAGSFGDVRHESELVFASVPDADAAAVLAKRLAAGRNVIGAISIDDARGVRTGDVVLNRAPGDLIASSTLAETAQALVGIEGVPPATPEPPLGQIARLAVGVSFGTQARLLSEGIDAIALSATGELPPRDGDGAPERVLSTPLEAVGEIALEVVQALDAAPELPDEEGSYVRLGDNVVPGWAFAFLSLMLLFPALLGSVDALARAARRGDEAAAALRSVLRRSLPFLAAAALLYLFAGTGVVPDPGFPFDPNAYRLGGGELVVLAVLALAAVGCGVVLRVWTLGDAYGPQALAAAAGLIATLAVLGIWAANPFAALLAAPIAHVWTAAAGERPRRALALGLVVAAPLPIIAALLHVAGRLDLGGDAPWTLAMLITGGQMRAAQVVIACVLAGILLSMAVASIRRPAH